VTASSGLFLFSVILLLFSWFLLQRAFRGEQREWTPDANFPGLEDDPLALEVGAGIFNADDWELVRREASAEFTRGFRYERTMLALEWLTLVRAKVRRLVRDHRRAVRFNSSVRTVDEVRLMVEFVSFEVVTAVLWCVVFVRGPVHAARLLRWSLECARKLRNIADRLAPDSGSALNGIVKTNS
jgi:hypothetical protein